MKVSELEKGKDFKVPSKIGMGDLYLTIAMQQFGNGRVSVYSHSTGNTVHVPEDYEVTPVNKIPADYLHECRNKVGKKEKL